MLSIALSVNPFPKASAQDPGTVITIGAEVGKRVYDAVIFLHDHWDYLSWFFTGMNHTWWVAVYQDGFATYNDFRSYRTSDDAYNYFVLGNGGDCDAIYYDAYGRTWHICYQTPFQANAYSQQHGPIVDIAFQTNSGWHSILQY